jgi:tRNA nucleotidyltransferase/poly(A) polymerase
MALDTDSHTKYVDTSNIEEQWREISHILGCLEAWNGYKSRIVGGCVRDLHLGVTPKDIDIATAATPDQVAEVFKHNKIIPTGLQHGTITLVLKNNQYEITTLRVDKDCNGRHATVEYTNSFKEDALRRDFTMNAMSIDMNGRLYDYFDGIGDLENKIIRFVGDARQRIQEDYLRIMRLFRFASNYNLSYRPEDLEVIKELCQGLRNVSAERITAELLKTLGNPWTSIHHIRKMYDLGVLNIVLPEFSYDFAEEQVSKVFVEGIPGFAPPQSIDPIISLALMLPNSTSAEDLAIRMKLTNRQKKILSLIFSQQAAPATRADGIEIMERLFELTRSAGNLSDKVNIGYFLDVRLNGNGVLTKIDYRGSSYFAIPFQGSHLLQAGISPGKQVGELLKYLKWTYRNGMWYNVPDMLNWIKSLQQDSNLAMALIDPEEHRREIARIIANNK